MTAETHHPVACPFCGLLCDDLTVTATDAAATLTAPHCPRAAAGFAAAGAGAQPRLAGRDVPLAEAVDAAAALLAGARNPLVGGLAADVAGQRAALALAERLGATVDHMNSAALFRNLRVLQDRGWMTTTLTEVRNRADLLVVVGGDVSARFPRFFERFAAPSDTLTGGREAPPVVFLGAGPDLPIGNPSETLPCEPARLAEVLRVVQRLVRGRPPATDAVAGIAVARLAQLAERLKAARYAVVTWTAADLDLPHAELTVQAAVELVVLLNRETRCAGLPLGGSDGDLTATQVATWQSGYPLRVSYADGAPDYDPDHHGAARRLALGAADALLWIAALDPARRPPDGGPPTVVLGHPAMTFGAPPAVFIPVGVPGVVVVPLRRLLAAGPPSAAAVLTAIHEALPGRQRAAC